jgi:hypothetical protein
MDFRSYLFKSFHKSHPRPANRLAYCLRVSRVVFVALDVSFHILRRHQPNLVAELRQLTCPVVRGGTGLHTNEARRQGFEELHHLTAAKLLPDDDPSRPRIGSSAQIEVCKPEGKITKGKARAQLDRCFGR